MFDTKSRKRIRDYDCGISSRVSVGLWLCDVYVLAVAAEIILPPIIRSLQIVFHHYKLIRYTPI